MKPSSNLAAFIERYFTVWLVRQRNFRANMIASYRDTFRLLFTFAKARLRKPPSTLSLDDLDAPLSARYLLLSRRREASASDAQLCVWQPFAPSSGLYLSRSRLTVP